MYFYRVTRSLAKVRGKSTHIRQKNMKTAKTQARHATWHQPKYY